MQILIDGLNVFYDEKVRLVKTLMKRESSKEYPEPLKWALQMLYFNCEEWIEICRIDNYPHEGKTGSHVHVYGREEIKKVKLTFLEADEVIKEISVRILKDVFNEEIKFE
ncbi:MAG: DUF6516 family protein [Candidatus Woesearchaeota archaeon]